jgi:hypothetical protein
MIMVLKENSLVYEFGGLLWELISRQQHGKPREGLSLVLFLKTTIIFVFAQLIVQLLAI